MDAAHDSDNERGGWKCTGMRWGSLLANREGGGEQRQTTVTTLGRPTGCRSRRDMYVSRTGEILMTGVDRERYAEAERQRRRE